MDEHLDVVKLMSGANEAPEPSKAFSEALARNLAKLSEVYQRELTPLAVLGYRDALKDLTVEQLNSGFDLAIKGRRFITPFDIRQYALGEQTPKIGDPCYAAKSHEHDDCELCQGTGWKMVSRVPGSTDKWAVKCDHGIARGA